MIDFCEANVQSRVLELCSPIIDFPTLDLLLASLGGSGGSGLSPHSDYRLLNLILHLLCTLRGKTQGQQNQKSVVCQSFNGQSVNALDQKKCSIKTINQNSRYV